MTASTAVATRPAQPLMAGGEVLPIIPKSVEEMFRVATAISQSGLAPRTLDTKEKVLVAVMAGAELGLAPHQAVQSFYVVNNRPTLWGDAIPALLWANGFKLREWLEGEGDALTAYCEVTRPGGEVIPGEFSVSDAKKAKLFSKDGPWQTAPKRMLKMRARAFAARDGASDVLKGFQIREEVEDYQPTRDVTNRQPTGMRARLEARTAVGGFDADHVAAELDAALDGDRIPDHDAETGEVIEVEVEPPAAESDFPGDRPSSPATREASDEETQSGAGGVYGSQFDAEDPVGWAVEQNRLIDEAETVADLEALSRAPDAGLWFDRLQKHSPGIAKELDAHSRGRLKALRDKERAAP